MKIGVFDSGVGGLSVLKSLLEHQLFEEIIYYGDTARVPYGVKDKNTIIRYSLDALEFFKNFEIDLLIVACNTASAFALNEMKKLAPFDVIGVIEPGIIATTNALTCKEASILILATKATIASKSYQNRLHVEGFNNINAIATSLFVPIVEENIFSGDILQSTMNHYFKNIAKPDAIILGCTHFPLISKAISTYFNDDALIIHSGEAIVEYLQNSFNLNRQTKKCELKLFASENPEGLKAVAYTWLNS